MARRINGRVAETVDQDQILLRQRASDCLERSGGYRVRIVDLFCGCGGMTLGAALAAREYGRDIEIRLAADADTDILGIYRSNFGSLVPAGTKSQEKRRISPLDVGKTFSGRGRELTDTESMTKSLVGGVDLMFGGPPCQGNSDLNNHTRRTDSRNAMYLRMARAAQVLKPKVLIVENVPPVVHDQNDVVAAAKRSLRRGDYQVSEDVVLRMDRLGVPQRRKRHLLIASRLKKVDVHEVVGELAEFWEEQRSVRWAIQDLLSADSGEFDRTGTVSPENRRRIGVLFDENLRHLPNERRPPCHQGGGHSYLSIYGRMDWDEPAQTITTGFGSMGQGCYVHPARRRTITPHEAARLQTFPDFFSFGSTAKRTVWARAIGNAVPPLAMRALLRPVLARLIG